MYLAISKMIASYMLVPPPHPQKEQKRNPDWFNLSYFTSSKTNYVVAIVVIADLALAR